MPPIVHPNVSTIHHESVQEKWIKRFPRLFEERVGLIKNQKVKLHIDPNIKPRQEKLIPFHLRSRVAIELSKIIELVNGPNRSGSQKKRKQRDPVCTDARCSNQAIQRERHIAPTKEDLVVKLNGASIISKFDLKSGYN